MNDRIKKSPDDYTARGFRSIILAKNGKYTSAIRDIEKLCREVPTLKAFNPYALKSEWLLEIGKYNEAITAGKLATLFLPKQEVSWSTYAIALANAGIFKEAGRAFQKASEINPDNSRYRQLTSEMKKYSLLAEENIRDYNNSVMETQLNAFRRATSAFNATAVTLSNLNRNNPTVVNNNNFNDSGSSSQKSIVKEVECSLCHGKGWIAGTKGVSIGGSYYCDECHREVPSSHSHDICPSCRGNKTIKRISH